MPTIKKYTTLQKIVGVLIFLVAICVLVFPILLLVSMSYGGIVMNLLGMKEVSELMFIGIIVVSVLISAGLSYLLSKTCLNIIFQKSVKSDNID